MDDKKNVYITLHKSKEIFKTNKIKFNIITNRNKYTRKQRWTM